MLWLPRTAQPSIIAGLDFNNPITKGLVFASTLVSGTAYVASPQGVRMADGVHTYGVGARAAGRLGGRAGVFSTGAACYGVTDMGIAVSQWSVLWVGRITGAGGGSLGRLWAGGGTVYSSYSTASTKRFALNGGQYDFAMADNVDSVVIFLAISSSTTPSASVYVNGVSVTLTVAAAFSAAATLTGNMAFGNQSIAAGARVHAGEIVLGAVANRLWSVSEVLSLSKNPWQLFAPTRRVWMPANAAAGAFVLPANAGAYT